MGSLWSVDAAIAVLATGLCVLSGVGCGPARDVAEAAPPPPCDAFRAAAAPEGTSLVLVVNDAMRRDRLGAYGGPASTPHFDAFARENLLFLNVASAAPWTKPAVASLFTSLHPSQHGIRSHPEAPWSEGDGGGRADVLPDGFVTLAEALGRAGFRTAAFVANPWLTRGFGYEQGFEVYDDSFAAWDTPGAEVVADALEWLAAAAPPRFFLYVHTMDSHLPYGVLRPADLEAARAHPDPRPVPPEANQYLQGLRVQDGRGVFYHEDVPISLTLIERAYDRGIESFDDALGRLLDAARPGTPLGRAAIVITSDHGEALFEHGFGNHARSLREEEIALPLAAKLPGVEPSRAEVLCPVGLVDLMASLCEYLGADCPDGLAGRSFLSGGRDAPARYLVSEGVPRYRDHRAIRNRRYKLVYAPHGPNVEGLGLPDQTPEQPYALYDLAEDPRETRDLLDAFVLEPGVAGIRDRMRAGLEDAVPPAQMPAPAAATINPEVKARLEALGYRRRPADAPPR